MIHLPLQTQEYERLISAYGEWLRLLNFEPSTVHYGPVKLREFFYRLEEKNITDITAVTRKVVADYFEYLKTRQNQTKGGRLGKNYLRTHLHNLRKFGRYLRETERESFETTVRLPGIVRNIKTVFTREEINALYEASDQDLLGMRDRAMLAVYYGCGLRKSEGINLDISDFPNNGNLLYVRKGKNYKERYVPMTATIKEHIKEYVDHARPCLLKAPCEALFLATTGNRPCAMVMINRFQKLLKKAGIDKPAGLHALRHSIATHLLQSGMKLEQISRFLGHSSLESTQIYTHITHERKAEL